ncbi:hypothetical protein BASA81_002068 [Batrachochytrium salamandrivorans]|nr:hypothetical protein BASA81_002068 [Batrachochytrium salamandrivorans]
MLSVDVRRPLSKKYGVSSPEHVMAKKLVKISFQEKGKLIKEEKLRVLHRVGNRLKFETEDIIKIIKDNATSTDPMKRAVALLIASGCRPIEFFEKANFKPNPEQGPNWVFQDFVAKRKDKKLDDKPLTKPIVYLSAVDFIKGVKSIRDDLHKQYPNFMQANGNLISAISTRSNKVAKEIFNRKEGLTLYTSRKIYGAVSYELFSETTQLFGTEPGIGAWLNGVLGHSPLSLDTAQNYAQVKLVTDKTVPEQLVIKQEILENKIEDIEERLDQDLVPEVQEKPKEFNTTNKIVLEQFKLIDAVYQKYVKDNIKVPSQAALEKLAKTKAPRAVIRLFYKDLKK